MPLKQWIDQSISRSVTHMHTHTHTHMHTHMRTHMRTHMHTHTHTHLRTHMHTRVQSLRRLLPGTRNGIDAGEFLAYWLIEEGVVDKHACFHYLRCFYRLDQVCVPVYTYMLLRFCGRGVTGTSLPVAVSSVQYWHQFH